MLKLNPSVKYNAGPQQDKTMSKIAFFVNPLSHTVAKRGSVLQKYMGSDDIQIFVLNDFSELPKYVEVCAKTNVDLIFIEGGDGTIQGVITEIIKQETAFGDMPELVLLAGGMTNLIAMQIGLKKPSLAKITDMITEPQGAKSVAVPLVRVDYAKSKNRYYGFLLSTGAIATATRYTAEKVHTAGINGSAAVRTTLRRALFGGAETRAMILKTSPLGLEIDGGKIQGDHILSLTSTLPKSMLGFNLFWAPPKGPLKTSYVKAGAPNKIRNLARLINKRQSAKATEKLDRDGFHSWACDKFTMFHNGPIVLDGEFLPLTDKAVKISVSQPLLFLS